MKKMESKFILFWMIAVFSMFGFGCSPKFYLIDRQTVLEEEAAGEWPDFEKEVLEKSKMRGPTPLVKTQNSAKKNRIYNVLNGELTSQSEAKHEAKIENLRSQD